MIYIARDVEWCRTVKVGFWMVIHIGDQGVDIKVCDLCSRPRLRDLAFKWCAVRIDVVESGNSLVHTPADLSDVASGNGRLVLEKLRRVEATVFWGGVLWEQLQRCEVHKNEVASAILVQTVHDGIHAVEIVGQRLARSLTIS